MDSLTNRLLLGQTVEFSYQGKAYLIQEENNKGWDYLSLWRTAPEPACLGRAFFDILDGISEETVRELLTGTKLDGRTLREVLQEVMDGDSA